MAKVIIFGIKDLAELAYYYLSKDSKHEVVAFSVTGDYLPAEKKHHDLPIVAFEGIERPYPPDRYQFFVPMTHDRMNKSREAIYRAVKNKGYACISYVSSRAIVSDNVMIGENCFILENNTLQPFVYIGNNVVLWTGGSIAHHSKVHDHVFIAAQVVISGHCEVEPYCFIGVNAVLKEGTKLGEGTFVSMSGVIMKDTKPYSVHKTNSSKVMGISSEELFK